MIRLDLLIPWQGPAYSLHIALFQQFVKKWNVLASRTCLKLGQDCELHDNISHRDAAVKFVLPTGIKKREITEDYEDWVRIPVCPACRVSSRPQPADNALG